MALMYSKLLKLWKRLIVYGNLNSTSIISEITKTCGAIPILWDPNKREHYVVAEGRARYFRNYILVVLLTLYFGLHFFGRKLFHAESSNNTKLTTGESLLYLLFTICSQIVTSLYYFVSDPQSFCQIRNNILAAFNNLKGNKR